MSDAPGPRLRPALSGAGLDVEIDGSVDGSVDG